MLSTSNACSGVGSKSKGLRSVHRHADHRVHGESTLALGEDRQGIYVKLDQAVAVMFGERGDGDDGVDGGLTVSGRTPAEAVDEPRRP